MSYPFSQGLPYVQREIFKYIHYKRPDITMNEGIFAELDLASQKAVAKFFNGMLMEDIDGSRNVIHQPYHLGVDEKIEPITKENIRGIVHEELINFRDTLNGGTDGAYSIEEITRLLIHQDLEYLNRPKGRPRIFIDPKSNNSPLLDSWFSYYCHYSFLGISTGLQEFDDLAADINTTVQENPQEFSPFTAEIIKLYNLKHPSDPVEVFSYRR